MASLGAIAGRQRPVSGVRTPQSARATIAWGAMSDRADDILSSHPIGDDLGSYRFRLIISREIYNEVT